MPKLVLQSEDDIEENSELSGNGSGEMAGEKHAPIAYMEPYEAYVTCMRMFGRPDMQFLTERTGRPISELAEGLDLYQDPVRYDIHKEDAQDWYPFSFYVCNQHIPRLYKETKAMEEKYPGRFSRNIKVLEAHYPKLCGLTAYDLTPGTRMIPNWLYGEIFQEILGVLIAPEVSYNKATERYSVRFKMDPSYVVNHVEYGTRHKGIKDVLPALMNGDEIEVREPVFEAFRSRPRYVRNEPETVELLAKVKDFMNA